MFPSQSFNCLFFYFFLELFRNIVHAVVCRPKSTIIICIPISNVFLFSLGQCRGACLLVLYPFYCFLLHYSLPAFFPPPPHLSSYFIYSKQSLFRPLLSKQSFRPCVLLCPVLLNSNSCIVHAWIHSFFPQPYCKFPSFVFLIFRFISTQTCLIVNPICFAAIFTPASLQTQPVPRFSVITTLTYLIASYSSCFCKLMQIIMQAIPYALLISILALSTNTESALLSTSSDLPWVAYRNYFESKKNCLGQQKLVCRLRPTKGNRVTGTVSFRPVYRIRAKYGERCGVLVHALIQNLKKGKHGFHIHEFGDLRRDDASLHGGHFANPFGRKVPHGFPTDDRRHWGDLGNLIAWGGGNAKYLRVDSVFNANSIVGRSIVVHADEDIGVFGQPSGDSGSRVASCVIGFANTAALPLWSYIMIFFFFKIAFGRVLSFSSLHIFFLHTFVTHPFRSTICTVTWSSSLK